MGISSRMRCINNINFKSLLIIIIVVLSNNNIINNNFSSLMITNQALGSNTIIKIIRIIIKLIKPIGLDKRN